MLNDTISIEMKQLILNTLYIFFLINLCALNPLYKTLTIFFCLIMIFRSDTNHIFIGYTWVNYLMFLNPMLIGWINIYDNLLRILIVISSFIIIYLKNRKNIKKFGLIFKLNTYICLTLFFLSLMQYPNDLLFLSLLKLLLFYFGSSFFYNIDLLSNKKEIYSWMFGLFINSILFSF